MPMIETLYKTKTPQLTVWAEDFFELTLGTQKVDGKLGYFVRETQCRWDDAAKRTIRVQYTLSPREGFATIEDARQEYDLQRMNRARRGYIHSFTPRYEATKKNYYVLIEIPRDRENVETTASPVDTSEP